MFFREQPGRRADAGALPATAGRRGSSSTARGHRCRTTPRPPARAGCAWNGRSTTRTQPAIPRSPLLAGCGPRRSPARCAGCWPTASSNAELEKIERKVIEDTSEGGGTGPPAAGPQSRAEPLDGLIRAHSSSHSAHTRHLFMSKVPAGPGDGLAEDKGRSRQSSKSQPDLIGAGLSRRHSVRRGQRLRSDPLPGRPVGTGAGQIHAVERRGRSPSSAIRDSLTNGRVRQTKRYTAATIDWLAVYDATTSRCFYIQASDLGSGKSAAASAAQSKRRTASVAAFGMPRTTVPQRSDSCRRERDRARCPCRRARRRRMKRWSQRDSNPRPLPCKGSALPTELWPHGWSIVGAAYAHPRECPL